MNRDPGDQNVESTPTPDSDDPSQLGMFVVERVDGGVLRASGPDYEDLTFHPHDSEVKPRARSTVDELRETARGTGEVCPCCGGRTKLYRRKLNSGMAAILCWMTANHPGEWVKVGDMPRFCADSNEVSKLQHWGMVDQQENESTAKRTSGVWRTTPHGERFARNKFDAPSHIFLRSPGNVLEAVEESTVRIVDALGEHFNYTELMRGE